MSTSHDDKPGTDAAGNAPAEAAGAPGTDAETAHAPTGDGPGNGGGAQAAAEGPGSGTAGKDASEDFLMGTPLPSATTLGGVFSAETFAVAGLLLLAPVILNSRLFEFFGWFVLNGGSAVPAGYPGVSGSGVMVAGGLSALAVLSGAVSLFRSGAHTRASARWVSAATVLVGALFLLIAVATYASMPAPSESFGWFDYGPYSGNG